MLQLSLPGAREPHVNRDIRFFLEPQIRDWILPKAQSNKKSLGKSSHSKFSHCCLTISRCTMVAGFVSQYNWLLKLLKGQIIIVMIFLWNSMKITSSTDWIPSFTLQALHTIWGFPGISIFFFIFWKNMPRQSQLSHLWEGPQRYQRVVAPLLWRKAEKVRIVKLGEEKAPMRLKRTFQDLKEVYNKAGEELQRRVLTGWGEMASNHE